MPLSQYKRLVYEGLAGKKTVEEGSLGAPELFEERVHYDREMVVSKTIDALGIVSQGLHHIVSDVFFSLNVKEDLDIVVDFFELGALDKESKE